ncbi:hypothetical protein VKT23_006674 [Stygiomarasmius scandens]|uniref:Uncharacterized protein n=1 Tax=Marasmiellus scandens TaxID=2682957 RepID=A0ABR1JSV6_9AGAR
MDGDVDMEAPQISTLRDEPSPPPQAKANPPSRLRVKLVVKDKSKSASTSAPSSSHQKNPDEEEGDEDDDDQEDQLIDDDEPPKAGSSSPKKKSTPSKGAATTTMNTKGKARKNAKRPPEEGRLREKVQQQPGAPNLSPTMLLFDAGALSQPGGDVNYQEEELPTYLKPPPKKKQKKAPAPKEKKEKEKATSKIKVKLIPPTMQTPLEPPLEREDVGALSEGVAGTVASSPAVNPVEEASHASHSPEPEQSFALPPPAIPPSQPEEINLDGVPVPVYPLPNKPFPVLPPPKVGSGFAPTIPLDRSGTKVRQWRVALREIRGIGGGRWFTRAWVGEKQSQFATEAKMNNEMRKALADSGVAIPKLPAMSISAPAGKGKGKAKAGTASSLSQSTAPSRAESIGPEGAPLAGMSASAVRAPSKMRISQVPPPPASEAGDSISEVGAPDV